MQDTGAASGIRTRVQAPMGLPSMLGNSGEDWRALVVTGWHVAGVASTFVTAAEAALGGFTLVAGGGTGAVERRSLTVGLLAWGGVTVVREALGSRGDRSDEEAKKKAATKANHDRDPFDRTRPTTPRPRRKPA